MARELELAVIERGVRPERIVATTFTRKAAAELIDRGRQALIRVGRPDDAESFGAARIGTVNAVAGMIVGEFAFEAGLSPNLLVLDEARADEAFRRSLSDAVLEDDLAELGRLSSRFAELPWPAIVKSIADAARANRISAEALADHAARSMAGFASLLAGAPAVGPGAVAVADTGAGLFTSRLESALEVALAELRDRLDRELDKTAITRAAFDTYQRAAQRLRTQRHLPWPDWARLSTTTAGAKSDGLCRSVRSAAATFIGHPEFMADCQLAIQLAFDLARRALLAYQRFKVDRRAIDFVDQETMALELLQNDEVRGVLSADIELVLVDEFQDVSPLQLALFLTLAELAPRSVWVGDQKQAIYGFRGADPALMELVVAEVLSGAEPETLNVGRRSRAPLVRITNALFVPPFAHVGLPANRVELEPSEHEDQPILGPYLERWRISARNAGAAIEELSAYVASLVADPTVHVRDRLDGSPRALRPGDVAILCRRRDTCLGVAECLAELGVRSEVARVGLMSTLEGRAVFAGLRLWANPTDALAEAELVRILDPAGVSIDALVDPTQRALKPKHAAVRRLLDRRSTAPFAGAVDAFDGTTDALEMDDWVERWGRGATGRANVDALRAHAVSFARLAHHHGGSSSPAALVEHLRALADEHEDAQAVVDGDDAVQITTWHASKGLEWPLVVLFELDSAFSPAALGVHVEQDEATSLRLERPLEGRIIRYWPDPLPANASRSPYHDLLRQHPSFGLLTERHAREELRLLYVGWTRARDRLVLASRKTLSDTSLKLFELGGGPSLTEPTPLDPIDGRARVEWGAATVDLLVRPPPAPRPAVGRILDPPALFVRPPRSRQAPLWVRPSDLEGYAELGTPQRLGLPITPRGNVDPSVLGSAVHGFFAADRGSLDVDERAELASRVLTAWCCQDALWVDDLLELSRRLRQWVVDQWPGSVNRYEWPIEHHLHSGSVVRGTIDMLVCAAGEAQIIDHKVLRSSELDALTSASQFGGQLRAYADALATVGSWKRLRRWIHLPLSGIVVELFDRKLDETPR